MKLNKIFLFVFIGGLFSSCRGGADVYEVFDNELTTLAERAKWNYEHITKDPLFYEKNGDFYLVSFSIVASCQKDSLQNRLSKERACYRVFDELMSLDFKCVLTNSPSIEVFDTDKEFSQDTIPYAPDAGIKSITIDGDSAFDDLQDEDWVELPYQHSNHYDLDCSSVSKIISNPDSIMYSLQPLMRFSGEFGEMVYGYYLLLPWNKSIKLYETVREGVVYDRYERITLPDRNAEDIWDELDKRNNNQKTAE